MAARISTSVSEDDVCQANMDTTAFVNTALRRKNRQTDRTRKPQNWMKPQVENSHEVPESKLMSMRWVPPWKPLDEHPQGTKAKVWNPVYKLHSTVLLFLVYSCAGTNDDTTKFCTTSLFCTQCCAFAFFGYQVLFGPRDSTFGKGRRFEPHLSRSKEWCCRFVIGA